MTRQSIYSLSSKIDEEELKSEIQKRKNSLMTVLFDEFWFSYDFSIMELFLKIANNFNEINEKISLLNKIEKNCLFRDMALDELFASFTDRFRPVSKKTLFAYWIYENGKGNSSLIDGYKELIGSSEKPIKDIYDLKRLYDFLIKPRNLAYHLKNIKKYHYFRTEELILNDKSNLFLNEKGAQDEQTIIKKMTRSLELLNSTTIDQYTKIGIFFFLFMNSMPFYNENYFMAKYVISTYLWNVEKNFALALSIGGILSSYKKLLITSYEETVSQENHGDLSHFVYVFLQILLDGSSRLLQEMAINENKKVTLLSSFKEKGNSKTVSEILVSSSVYSEFGTSIYEIKEISGISLPTINRFLAKYSKNIKKTRFIKRDYYSIK